MPKFTVESAYNLPIYRHVTYEAATAADACEMAMEDGDWSMTKPDFDNSGATRITGVWEGEDAAYEGPALPVPLEPIVPTLDGIRDVVRHHWNEAAANVVGGRSDPTLDLAINAALDILAQALLQIRVSPGITVGMRVRFKRKFEFNHPLSGDVAEGELGTVTKIDAESTWVRLDAHQDQLDEWDNEVQLYDWRAVNNNPLDDHAGNYLQPAG